MEITVQGENVEESLAVDVLTNIPWGRGKVSLHEEGTHAVAVLNTSPTFSFSHLSFLWEHLFTWQCTEFPILHCQTGMKASLSPPGSLGTRGARPPAGEEIPTVSNGGEGGVDGGMGMSRGTSEQMSQEIISWTEDPGSAWDCTSKQKEFGWSDNGCGVEKFGRPWSEIKDFRKATQMPFPHLQCLILSPSSELLWSAPSALPGSCSFLILWLLPL